MSRGALATRGSRKTKIMAKKREKLPSVGELASIYKRLLLYVKPYRLRFYTAVVMNIAFAGATGGLAYLVKPLINNIVSSENLKRLTMVTIVVVGVNILRALTNVIGTYFMRYTGLRVITDIRDQLYSHIQSLPLKFFSDHHTGLLTSRITNDVNLVTIAVTDAVEAGVKETFTILALITVVFVQDWTLALIAFSVFPLMAYPISRLSKSMRKISTRGQVKTADITSVLMETFSGARIVKAFGMEEYESKRFGEENLKLFKTLVRRAWIRAISAPIMEIIGTIGFAFFLWYGGYRSIGDPSFFGTYVSIITALMLIYPSVRALTRLNNNIQEAIAASIRIFDVLDTKSDIIDKPDAAPLDGIKKGISFDDVSFKYDDEEVLEDINFDVRAGEVVAFVGMSGGGKTTLVNLIPRFYDVIDGAIRIDGKDIRDVTLKSLRAHIGMVTQQTILFSDTIRDNIAYGNKNRPQEDIEEAARAANAHKFIEKFPEGYDTFIGEQGMRLSGGERQRISIARAILKDAPILVLDEATSSLDTESEMEVQKALENLMKGRTTFVIAHRLSTIKYANRIMVVVNGKIVEEGTHDELLKRSGEYKKLYDMQFRDMDIPTETVKTESQPSLPE